VAQDKKNRPILVPVDFSANSKAALALAAELADLIYCPISVLHVVHDPGDAPGYYRVKGRQKQISRLEDRAGEMLEEFMEQMVAENPDSHELRRAKRMLVVGLPVTRILELVKKLKPKMLVIGGAGRTGLSRYVLGSKAEQLARLCPIPVTIVKLPDGKE
jgi:nucleotide-binding universal stress UspA family protein